MSLPNNGPISTNDIIGQNGLNIAPGSYSFEQLWSIALENSVPNEVSDNGGPYVLANNWYGYNNATTLILTLKTLSSNLVDLTWVLLIGGDGFVNTGYRVYKDGSQVGGTIPPNVFGISFGSLAPSTTFSFYVEAFNGTTIIKSNTLSVTTPAAIGDTVPPNAFLLTAGTIAAASNQFTWTNTGDNVAVVGYRIYRNGSLVTTVGVINNYTDTGLTPVVSYNYYIQAFDAAGNVRNSNTINMITITDTIPPNVFDIYSGPQYLDKIMFTWDNTKGDNVAVIGFRIFKDGALKATVAQSVNAYTDYPLQQNVSHNYYVQAYDAAGNTRDTITVHLSTSQDSIPPGPFTLSTGTSTTSSNSMSWTASADTGGIAKYVIVRDAGGNGITRMEVAGNVLSFTDTGLESAYLYSYYIEAEDFAGNSTASNTIQMFTNP